MMPTVKSVESLSAISFDPLIGGNPHIFKKSVVTTNKISTKTINGRSMVFVGAQPVKIEGGSSDSGALRSTPCDRVDRDEVDLMHPDMVEMSKQRLQRSRHRIENNWGSPTVPHWGIDLLYDQSDQRKWQIKCGCGKYTCLGETFPDCIKVVDGAWARVCVHCGKQISVGDGEWVADYPERREAGFWVSGLLSPFCDLEDAMYRYQHNDKSAEFMRSILGIATTDAECQLTHQAVRECCSNDRVKMSSACRTVMGVDINKTLNAVVGVRTGDSQYHILSVFETESYQELHEYAKKMNVHLTVMDSGPYSHAARDYQKTHNSVYLCQYSETQPGDPKWGKDKMVKVNRNEWCDKVYDNVMEKKIILPHDGSPLMKRYLTQMTSTEKTELMNEAGQTRMRWQKRGCDDAFHATLYFMLAASRVAPVRTDLKQRERPKMATNNWR
jgi:phage terminase large subunit GpA-like protein